MILRAGGLQTLPNLRQLLLPTAIGQKAVMANPHKPFEKTMQQETPDQFFSIQRHDFVSVVIAVVFLAKIDFIWVDRQNTRVAEHGFTTIAAS